MLKSLSDIINEEEVKINTEESYLKAIRRNLTKTILSIDPSAFISTNPETGLSLPRIVCAAIQNENGDVIVGARHYDAHMRKQLDIINKLNNAERMFSCHDSINHWKTGKRKVQGFVDQHNNFYTREESWVIALDRDQIIRIIPGCEGILYSENLY